MLNQLFYGPLWPLPRAVYGTAITSGLTGLLETTEYNEAVAKDIIVSAPSTNTGDIYFVLRDDLTHTFSKNNDGTVIFLLSPGSSRNISLAAYGSNLYKLEDIGVDADDDYDDYFACAIMQ